MFFFLLGFFGCLGWSGGGVSGPSSVKALSVQLCTNKEAGRGDQEIERRDPMLESGYMSEGHCQIALIPWVRGDSSK